MVWYELPNSVTENGMSFHSTHATSHALQPMPVVVSISFATVNSRWVSSPGTLPAWPLIFCTRSVAWLILFPSAARRHRPLNPFQLYEESLELRRIRIRIGHRRRKGIGRSSRGLAFVFGNPAIAPMNWQSNLINPFAIDG